LLIYTDEEYLEKMLQGIYFKTPIQKKYCSEYDEYEYENYRLLVVKTKLSKMPHHFCGMRISKVFLSNDIWVKMQEDKKYNDWYLTCIRTMLIEHMIGSKEPEIIKL
jgi:hypothetical protein